ncbi:MAG TPA: substrate-binding domain-containing protein [Verrucomicrobiae bacterium]
MQSILIPSRLALAAVLALTFMACNDKKSQTDRPSSNASAPRPNTAKGKVVIAMLPKLINIDYFDACKRGAVKAAEELGVTLIYDGPTEPSGSEQNKFIDTWLRQGVSAICIAPNQPKTIRRFVEKAQAQGIKVLTWDSDATDSGRDLFVNQVDEKTLGETLMDDLARQMGEEGEWAIAIASLDAANLNTWRRHAEARAREKYPKLKLVATEVTKEDENFARQKIETLLNAYPNLKGIIAFDSNSVPGASEAVKRAGKTGKVAITGNSTPGKMRPYIREGVLQSFYLWDPRALGALTVRLAKMLVEGQPIRDGMDVPGHGKVSISTQDAKTVIMADPIRFTKENIDKYDFGI